MWLRNWKQLYTESSQRKKIRDAKDYPVLYTAIIENVDILITGDKDFADIDIEKPEIMTPAEFMEEYL